jgi:hypothetical protein
MIGTEKKGGFYHDVGIRRSQGVIRTIRGLGLLRTVFNDGNVPTLIHLQMQISGENHQSVWLLLTKEFS